MEQEPRQEVLSSEELLLRFGVSSDEAAQVIQYGSYSGTLGQMLADERCPVGGQVEQRHIESGIEGVQEMMGQLGALGMKGSVVIESKTEEQYARAREVVESAGDPFDVKKN